MVTIVIPVYNLWEYTRACLQSLADCARGVEFRVVVVDNGSTDATTSECDLFGEVLFPGRFERRAMSENIGFARGCNAGAQGADTPFLLFLNNDITATPGWLEILLQGVVNRNNVHAASPLLLFPGNNRVQHAGIAFDSNLLALHCFSLFPGNHPALQSIRSLQGLSAAALLVRRDAFEAVGGFHPEYVNGSEDLDLSCMLRRRGGQLALVPQSVLHHATSMTPGRYDHTEHNRALLTRRTRGCFAPDLHRLAARAGYSMALTDWLAPHMVMARDTRLPETENTIPALTAALMKQPLWDAGYSALLGLLEHDPARALEWAETRATLCPSRQALEQAVLCAQSAGDQKAITRCKHRLAQVITYSANMGELIKVAESSLAWCRAEGQKELARLYETWLANHAAGA